MKTRSVRLATQTARDEAAGRPHAQAPSGAALVGAICAASSAPALSAREGSTSSGVDNVGSAQAELGEVMPPWVA